VRPRELSQHDRDGIRFFPGGAAGAPDPERPGGVLALESRRENLGAEYSELRGVAEKVALPDRQLGEDHVACRPRGFGRAQELGGIGDSQRRHCATHPGFRRRLPVGREDESREQVCELGEACEARIGESGRSHGRPRGSHCGKRRQPFWSSARSSSSLSVWVRKASTS
jgi:hypothetical protein